MTEPQLDHLVYAVPDLAAGVAEFAERTGVRPVAGGSHPGGTANHLVRFGPSVQAHPGRRAAGVAAHPA